MHPLQHPLVDYQLVDFGRGRKLERFGDRLLDRPSPAADGVAQAAPKSWNSATHRFVDKHWLESKPSSQESGSSQGENEDWKFRWETISLGLKTSPFGHVGVFPEQVENWNWFRQLGDHQRNRSNADSKFNALNLFAYTGGSTLALASSGFSVTHVDASKPAVQWARSNAAESLMTNHPIRWIVDDARDFVEREIRRNNRYDAIILDPPAFGHGMNGKRWQIESDLASLMASCESILSDNPIAILLTGHSPIESMRYGPLEPRTFSRISKRFQYADSKRSNLIDLKGRELDCGYIFRWFN